MTATASVNLDETNEIRTADESLLAIELLLQEEREKSDKVREELKKDREGFWAWLFGRLSV